MRELLETEQAYVARLHLLDQASGDCPASPPLISGVLTPAQDLALLTQPTDPVGWSWGRTRTDPLSMAASNMAGLPGFSFGCPHMTPLPSYGTSAKGRPKA